MRAFEIAEKAIERINAGDDFLVMNFANADMVGHTANKPAILIAVETVDTELKRVVEEILKHQGVVIITADHGNAEINIDPMTGEKHTAHTTSQVPCIVVSKAQAPIRNLLSNTLADIGPTILELLKLKQPASMTGRSLMEIDF
jgi:2,3-bisphosphoglycerate-independent phosphoglycerate mutase